MKSLLVSRPPYGEGHPRDPKAVAELPSGTPADKGLSLDPNIPGGQTFVKPVDDVRKDEPKDESMYHVERADDLLKDQTRMDQIDHSDSSTGYNGLGESSDDNPKTRYPYRNDKPDAHNASAFVVGLWRLDSAPTRTIKAGERILVAATRTETLTGLDTRFQERSLGCSAMLKRADATNLRWIFSVNCGNGPKVVKVKAIRQGNVADFGKMDLELKCSCKAWRWLGPEYHAKQESYMLGKPVGTASVPNVRDIERDNRVCKHVAAALATTRRWKI